MTMNERIRELAEQAENYAYSAVIGGEECQEAYTKRLTELIVKECARRCEDIAIKHQVEETTYAAGKKAGAFECAKDLKKHFGV